MHDKLKTNAAARKVYETDLQKVDRWCKDTDMKCAIEPALDCATEVLQEQYKQYKVKYLSSFSRNSRNTVFDILRALCAVLLSKLYTLF